MAKEKKIKYTFFLFRKPPYVYFGYKLNLRFYNTKLVCKALY